ncbi:uncharacterized protein SETTUDRAFT_103177 [Exserohilum turcica Et28A]|uniref:Uncharacterized protein n=1 Tax=Exserohilum turcicum (strain 28A) TaxID=671987 RepID=R0J027_EXST2|nr:uncharacterized protein SETTUDRAFT_103177 [Exserohilum turcica Et28A]EOA90360.1 hypothetical protein SETTUDRAFT_103177 [Exserohilum turcica Et28A]
MGLAPIERLPVELLQQIFVQADYNLALLQASPYIASRLSSGYIYNATCNHYLTEVHGQRAQQSAAQTQIFASKWMTWDFFQSWCIRRFETAGCLCDHTPEDGCFDAQWPPNFNDATTMIFSRSHLPRLSFVKGRIPKKLLRGPWSQEKIEFLRFLLWITSMSVDWNDPETAKIAVEGRRQAILKRKLEAVELFNHNRRLGKPPSLDTLCFAVTEAGCDRSIVFDTLLTTNIWSNKKRARYSETLHQWCDTQMEADNPKGLWLFQKLEESRIFRNRKEEIGGREACLYLEFGNYDGGPQDQLIVNDLEWNKVCRVFTFLEMKLSVSFLAE